MQQAPCFGSGVPEWQAPCLIEMPAPSIEGGAVETADASPLELLSNRERDVVRLVLEGATDAEIAARFGINLHTVGDRLRRAFRKLGVRNRTNLIVVLMFAESSRSTVTADPSTRRKLNEQTAAATATQEIPASGLSRWPAASPGAVA